MDYLSAMDIKQWQYCSKDAEQIKFYFIIDEDEHFNEACQLIKSALLSLNSHPSEVRLLPLSAYAWCEDALLKQQHPIVFFSDSKLECQSVLPPVFFYPHKLSATFTNASLKKALWLFLTKIKDCNETA